MNRTEGQVETLISPTVASLGCSVWGVEYLSQGKYSKLRIYIDKAGGVTVDDCAEVSRHVSDLLDVEDLIAPSYELEVSSPGLDRILFKPEQYAQHVGEELDVRLNYPFEGRRRLIGQLAGFENDEVLLHLEETEYVLPIENIRLARIVPNFD